MKVIFDNTVLSNFALIGQHFFLKQFFGSDAFSTEEVLQEFRQGVQKGMLPPNIDWSWLQLLEVLEEKELSTFHFLAQRFGFGEASCLALAYHRQYKIFTDDLGARKFAKKNQIPVSGTLLKDHQDIEEVKKKQRY